MEEWQVVHENLCTLASQECEHAASLAHWLRAAERVRVFEHVGCGSLLEYLERVLGYTPHTAKERLRVANALETLPKLSDALARGEMSFCCVRELTRVATPETEDEWIEAARGMLVRQVEELVAGRTRGDHPDCLPDPDVRKRRARFELSPEVFALVRQARQVLQEELGGGYLEDDAFIEALCKRALEGSADRAQHQIAITVCEKCKRGFQDGAGAVVEIDERALEQARCDAENIGSIDGARPDRANQDITPATRRFVRARDHGKCRVPGCRASYGIDIHHIVFRIDDGNHEPDNLILLCSAHHRALHEGLLVIRGNARGCHFEQRAVEPIRTMIMTAVPMENRLNAETKSPIETPVERRVSERDVAMAVGALTHMGYRASDAKKMVALARSHVGPEVSLKDLIVKALHTVPLPVVKT
jgi:hypothetical protein